MEKITIGNIRKLAGGRIDSDPSKFDEIEFGVMMDTKGGGQVSSYGPSPEGVPKHVKVVTASGVIRTQNDWYYYTQPFWKEGTVINVFDVSAGPLISSILYSRCLSLKQLKGEEPFQMWIKRTDNYNPFSIISEEEYILLLDYVR